MKDTTRSETGVVIDSEEHPSRTFKTSPLFAPLAVRVHVGSSAFLFYTPTKLLIRLYDLEIQNLFSFNYKYFFYI